MEATGLTETADAISGLGEDTLSAADSAEALQGLLDLLGGMGGHAAGPQHRPAHRDCWVGHRVGIDAVLDEGFPEHDGAVLVADVYGNDRRFGAAHIESYVAQPLAPLSRQLMQVVNHLWLALQDIESGEGSGGGGGWEAGAED